MYLFWLFKDKNQIMCNEISEYQKYFMITYKHVNMYVYMYVSPYIYTNIPLQAKSNQVFYSLCVWKILKQKFSGAIRKILGVKHQWICFIYLHISVKNQFVFFTIFFSSLFCFIIKLIFKATSPKLNKNQSHSISRKK